MLHSIARLFRGINLALGATAIPADASPAEEWKFVRMWLIMLALGAIWIGLLVYFLLG